VSGEELENLCQAKVCSERCENNLHCSQCRTSGRDCGDAASVWLSSFLGISCRLVRTVASACFVLGVPRFNDRSVPRHSGQAS
jgi:hypothetical protein